jgi:glycosyltransferase involved in cell wall biosynthesis
MINRITCNQLVSIITPTYNHELYIEDCIKSVLGQYYCNWELIIIDDGSTDQTWKIIEEYAEIDKRIHAFHQENKGIWRLFETYNFALKKAQGELIALLEGDDAWPQDKLSTQVNSHLTGGYALSFGQIIQLDNHGNKKSDQVYPNLKQVPFLNVPDQNKILSCLLMGEFFIPPVTVVFNRDALLQSGGFIQPDYLPEVAYPTCLNVISSSGKVGFFPKVLGFWRRHTKQITQTTSVSMFFGTYRYALDFLEQKKLDLNIPDENIANFLLGQKRKIGLADLDYWNAVIEFDKGNTKSAWNYFNEIASLTRHYLFLFFECLIMFAWKYINKLGNLLNVDKN